jgi:hypothetical protein
MGRAIRQTPSLTQSLDCAWSSSGDTRPPAYRTMFPGQVLTVPVSEPLRDLPGDVLHEWGGLLAALIIYRGC